MEEKTDRLRQWSTIGPGQSFLSFYMNYGRNNARYIALCENAFTVWETNAVKSLTVNVSMPTPNSETRSNFV